MGEGEADYYDTISSGFYLLCQLLRGKEKLFPFISKNIKLMRLLPGPVGLPDSLLESFHVCEKKRRVETEDADTLNRLISPNRQAHFKEVDIFVSFAVSVVHRAVDICQKMPSRPRESF